MAEHAREQPFRIKAVERVRVGMTDACRHDFDEDFTEFGPFEVEFDDLKRFFRLEGYGGAGLHRWVSLIAALMPPRPGICNPQPMQPKRFSVA
jgi:hypothetical protein